MIPASSLILAASHQVSSDLAGEAVILELNAGEYFGLNPVGAFIWNLIQQPRTVAALRAAILDRYAVEPERCERDLETLLHELRAADLIEIRAGAVTQTGTDGCVSLQPNQHAGQ